MAGKGGAAITVKEDRLLNRMSARKILLNLGFLTTGKMLGTIFTFLLFVVLSRTFGKEGIGQYSFAMALTGFFAVFADFGLYTYTIKEISQWTGSFREYYGRIFSLRLILSVVTFGMLLLVLPFLPFSYETKLIIAVIGAYQVINRMMEGLAAVFIAYEDMHLASLIGAVLTAAAALTGIVAVFAGGSLVMVLATISTVAFGLLFVAYWLVDRKYGRPKLSTSLSSLKRVLREAIPYALFIFLGQLSSRVNIVFLGFFLGAVAAGLYNVAYRVIVLLLFLPYFAGIAIFPLASRLYVRSSKELETLYHNSLKVMILIGLPASTGLCLIAPDLTSTSSSGRFLLSLRTSFVF